MKERLLMWLVQAIMTFFTGDIIKEAIDALFDVCEDAIARSATKVDDKLLLPMFTAARETLDVPDND